MNESEFRLQLYYRLHDYVTQRNCFADEADELDEEDKAAFIIASVSKWVNEQKISIMFRCASCIDPESPEVKKWEAECIRDLSSAFPEVAASYEFAVLTIQEHMPGLEF